jgi:hypothetical protein
MTEFFAFPSHVRAYTCVWTLFLSFPQDAIATGVQVLSVYDAERHVEELRLLPMEMIGSSEWMTQV